METRFEIYKNGELFKRPAYHQLQIDGTTKTKYFPWRFKTKEEAEKILNSCADPSLKIVEVPKVNIRDCIDWLESHGVYLSIYNGVAEPGYYADDTLLICSNWNAEITKKMVKFIEENWDENEVALGWDDEWCYCGNCYKAIRTSPDSYSWEPYYIWIADCELLCLDCAREDIEDILEEYLNNSDKAFPSDLIPEIEKIGFTCFSEEDYCEIHETGWHRGQDADPKKIEKRIIEVLGNSYEYIFCIQGQSQFYITWSAFVRRKKEDE